ncbi:MAG: galactosyltransferase-related protein [Candidatus Pacearchaeota archaeon]
MSSLTSDSHDVTFERWEEAANFFVIKRKVLEKVGGYSELFPYAAGEDSDLLIRLLKKGYKIRNQKTTYTPKRIRKFLFFKNSLRTIFGYLYAILKIWMFLNVESAYL